MYAPTKTVDPSHGFNQPTELAGHGGGINRKSISLLSGRVQLQMVLGCASTEERCLNIVRSKEVRAMDLSSLLIMASNDDTSCKSTR